MSPFLDGVEGRGAKSDTSDIPEEKIIQSPTFPQNLEMDTLPPADRRRVLVTFDARLLAVLLAGLAMLLIDLLI